MQSKRKWKKTDWLQVKVEKSALGDHFKSYSLEEHQISSTLLEETLAVAQCKVLSLGKSGPM